MRPTKLIISAFGSYSGKTVLELDKLGTKGLYLITGDTGAGKTTIFDAISFALYGDASGTDRNSKMFRSKYADNETPTYVELTFVYGGKEYYVKRNPDYERLKARGDGFTVQGAGVELKLPDGRVITRITQADNAIKEILGLDKTQFSQISMIAQGDFRKLLKAETKERKELFQKLFHTEKYRDLQETLASELKSLIAQNGLIKNIINKYISDIECAVDDEKCALVQQAKQGLLPSEEIFVLLEYLTAADDRLLAEIKLKQDENAAESKKLSEFLGIMETVKKTKLALIKNKEDLKSLIPKCEELQKEYDTVAAKQAEIKTLTAQSTQIKLELELYETAEALAKKITDLTKAVDGNKKKIAQYKVDAEAIAKTIAEYEKELELYERVGEELLEIKALQKDIENREKQLKDIKTRFDELKKLRSNAESALSVYIEKSKELSVKQSEYDAKYKAYLDDQAGIIAENLHTGEPCPVCGSTEHPKPATKSTEAPTKADLEKLKKSVTKCSDELTAASEKSGQAKAELKEKEKTVLNLAKQLFGTEDIADLQSIIAEKAAELDAKKTVIATKLAEAERRSKRKAAIQTSLPLKKDAAKQATDALADCEKLGAQLAAEKDSASDRLAELKSKLKFACKKEAEDEVAKLEGKKTAIENSIASSRKKLDECKEKIATLNGAVKNAEESLKDVPEYDEEMLKKRQTELKAEADSFTEKSKIAYSRFNANKKISIEIEKKSKELAEVENKINTVKPLAETANGRLNSKEKIALETYVQMTYFDRIIERANIRLLKMSNSQYELKRRVGSNSGNSQSGLGLNVVDYYNGSERDANSLSGGEGFMASLCLALGLSDEIQCSAGGVQLDSMFVDEGFGSLDPETLEHTMNALADLAEGNRLIGIISHVEDLKAGIDKQIIVKKDRIGGSTATIVV